MLNVLKGFVRQPTEQKQADDTVHRHVTHSNLKQRFIDIRVDLHTTIEGLKEKLRDRCITAVKSMEFQLYDKTVYEVLQDIRPFGFYSSLGVKGKRYFTCPSGDGSMLQPEKLKVHSKAMASMLENKFKLLCLHDFLSSGGLS